MNTISRGIHGIFSILLALILIVKGLYLFDLVPSFLAIAGIFAIAILMIGMILCRKYLFINAAEFLNSLDHRLSYTHTYIFIFVLSLLSKLIPILLFNIVSIYDNSDIQVYTETAFELATAGKAITHAGYCLNFNHIYWFSMFLSPVAKLFGISQTAFSVYLALCASISTLLIFDVLMHTLSPSKATLSVLIYTLLPSSLLLPQFITHEQAMLFFASISIWLYTRFITHPASRGGHLVSWILFLFSLLCTMLVNSAGIVLSIAVCIIFLVFPEKKNKHSRILKCAAVLCFLLAGNSICADIQIKYSAPRPDHVKSDKYLYTLFVGANSDTKASWSAEDSELFSAFDENASITEIDTYRKELLINRYQDLFRSPNRLIGLIKDKLVTIWSLLVYPIGFANETISSQTMVAFYNRFLFKPLVLIEYAIMLILTLFYIINLIFKRISINPLTLLFELYLLGMTSLLLLTECRNKYTISMQIFYIALCVGSFRQQKKNVS